MTLAQVILNVKEYKAGMTTDAEIIRWVNECEGAVYNNVFSIAADNDKTLPLYSEGDLGHDLLVPAPYDNVYYYYVCAKIDAANDEIINYDNNMAFYNSLYDEFAAYHIRNHKPVSYGSWRCF